MYLFRDTNVLFWWLIIFSFMWFNALLVFELFPFNFWQVSRHLMFYYWSLISINYLLTIGRWRLRPLIWGTKLSHAAKILCLLHRNRLQHQCLLEFLVVSFSDCGRLLIEFLGTFIINLISQKSPLFICSHPLMLGRRLILSGLAGWRLQLVILQRHQSVAPGIVFTFVHLYLY